MRDWLAFVKAKAQPFTALWTKNEQKKKVFVRYSFLLWWSKVTSYPEVFLIVAWPSKCAHISPQPRDTPAVATCLHSEQDMSRNCYVIYLATQPEKHTSCRVTRAYGMKECLSPSWSRKWTFYGTVRMPNRLWRGKKKKVNYETSDTCMSPLLFKILHTLLNCGSNMCIVVSCQNLSCLPSIIPTVVATLNTEALKKSYNVFFNDFVINCHFWNTLILNRILLTAYLYSDFFVFTFY